MKENVKRDTQPNVVSSNHISSIMSGLAEEDKILQGRLPVTDAGLTGWTHTEGNVLMLRQEKGVDMDQVTHETKPCANNKDDNASQGQTMTFSRDILTPVAQTSKLNTK